MNRLTAAALLSALLPAGAAFAQEAQEEKPTPTPTPQATPQAKTRGEKKASSGADLQLRRREELVVTATRTEQSAEDVPVSVTVVPREVLEQSPSRTLDDALRTVVGLNLPLGNSNVIQPSTNHVSMRGLGGDRALVLLDGIPLNDSIASYVQWNKAPLSAIERVEVARGAAASLFGNYAMGGVVNIFTRPLGGSQVDGGASYGSMNTFRADASVTEAFGPVLAAGLFADFEKTDGYIRTIPEQRGAIDIASDSQSLNLMAKLQAKGASGLEAHLKGNAFDHDSGQGTPISHNHRRIYDVNGGGTLPLGDSTLAANVFFQEGSYDIDNSQLVPGAGRDQEYYSQYSEQPGHDVGGSLQWSKPLRGLFTFFTTGLDLRGVTANTSSINYNQAGSVTGTRTVSGHQTFAGLFAEANVLPHPRLQILLSARVDAWWNTDGKEVVSGTGVTTYEDQSTTRFDPRLSLRWALSDVVALRGAAYRAFRAPTLHDLYRSSASRSQQVIANPFLGPETLLGGDVGVDLKAQGFTGQVNLYYNNVDGLIARTSLATTPILIVQPVNIGTARAQGVEVMGTVTLAKSVWLDFGYAFSDSIVTDNPANPTIVGNQIPGVSRNAGSLSLNWAPPWRLALTFRGRAQSPQYADDANLLATDAVLVFDLFVSYPITEALEVFVSGENLFDRQYVADVNLGPRLGPPQAFFGGVRLRVPLSRSGAAASEVR
jgi:outer membrane receptor protein involved in Fe transport